MAKQEQAVNEDSLVSQMDLDPDGVAGSAVNIGASVYSGLSRGAGALVAAPKIVSSLMDLSSLSEEERSAIGRYEQRKATPEDLALLNRKKAFYSENDPPEIKALKQAEADATPDRITPLELYERSLKDRETGRNIMESFDRSSTVHQGNRDALNDELGADFGSAWDQTVKGAKDIYKGDVLEGGGNLATGFKDLLLNAGKAVASNPLAVAEHAAENLPQLLVGGMGKAGLTAMTTMNASYAADNFQQGLDNYAAKHKGELPPSDKMQEMAVAAGLHFGAEQLSDQLLLGVSKAKKLFAPKDATEEAVRTGFKESLKGIGKATGGGVISEAPTEGFQTYLEGVAQDIPKSAKDIYIGTVIGGASGAAISGGVRTAAELTGRTPEKAKERATKADEQATLVAAMTSGDVSEYADPSKPTYAPDKAVQALFGHTFQEGTTEEVKTAKLAEAGDIVAKAQEQRDIKEEQLSKSTVAGLEKDIAFVKNMANPDPMLIKDLEAELEIVKAKLQDPKEAKAMEEHRKTVTKEIEQLDKQLSVARGVLGTFNVEQVRNIDLNTEIDAITNNAPEAPQAVKKVMNLAMMAPENLTPEKATALADDTDNALNTQERTYLRAFSAARLAANAVMDIDSVNQQVLNGDKAKQQMGIVDYRRRIAQALASGNVAQAEKTLGLLASFREDHTNKSELVTKAAELLASTGQTSQIISLGNGQWKMITKDFKSDKDLKKNGGLNIHPGTVKKQKNLVQLIPAEAAALTAAEQELRAVIDLHNGVETQVAPKQEATEELDGVFTNEDPNSDYYSDTEAQASAVDTVDTSGGSQVEPVASVPVSQPKTETKPEPAPVIANPLDGIPPKFLRNHIVTTKAYNQATDEIIDEQVSAKTALEHIQDDIDALEAFRACMKG
jgi:hypothetical protein